MKTITTRMTALFSAAVLLLTGAAYGQSGVRGLVPGKATRLDVERMLGKPVRVEAGTFAEYASGDASSKIFVHYRQGNDVVERIEVLYPAGKARAAVLTGLGLAGAPTRQQSNYLGNLEEFYAPAGIVLTHRGGGAAAGNVFRVSHYSADPFNAALARAGGTVASPGPKELTQHRERDEIEKAGEQRLHFDELAVGPLPTRVFERMGISIVQGDGAPGVYASQQNMVLPSGRSQVLLVAGDRTTSLTLVFGTPIRQFSLTRIGTAGGASVPTWTLQAFNSAGAIVSATGEEHGLPSTPQRFSIAGAEIVRVSLSTDNRFGTGTWATWNSLPVAEFGFKR